VKIKNKYWGEAAKGVNYKFVPKAKEVALTLDACGLAGDGCDYRIIDYLVENNFGATIFVAPGWINSHNKDWVYLINAGIFSIQNHGWYHLPSSTNGKKIYGIRGTYCSYMLRRDVRKSADYIQEFLGSRTRYFRSGAAYYDDASVQVINSMQHQVIGFNVLGDAGTTYSKNEAKIAVSRAKPGSIIIAHMNQPDRASGAGVVEGLKSLVSSGYSFVLLEDRKLVAHNKLLGYR